MPALWTLPLTPVLRLQLEKAKEKDATVARELIAAKRKDRALLVLKMKKLREQQLETAQKYFLNVLQVVNSFYVWTTRQLLLFSYLESL
jgi:hypothetical protein